MAGGSQAATVHKTRPTPREQQEEEPWWLTEAWKEAQRQQGKRRDGRSAPDAGQGGVVTQLTTSELVEDLLDALSTELHRRCPSDPLSSLREALDKAAGGAGFVVGQHAADAAC